MPVRCVGCGGGSYVRSPRYVLPRVVDLRTLYTRTTALLPSFTYVRFGDSLLPIHGSTTLRRSHVRYVTHDYVTHAISGHYLPIWVCTIYPVYYVTFTLILLPTYTILLLHLFVYWLLLPAIHYGDVGYIYSCRYTTQRFTYLLFVTFVIPRTLPTIRSRCCVVDYLIVLLLIWIRGYIYGRSLHTTHAHVTVAVRVVRLMDPAYGRCTFAPLTPHLCRLHLDYARSLPLLSFSLQSFTHRLRDGGYSYWFTFAHAPLRAYCARCTASPHAAHTLRLLPHTRTTPHRTWTTTTTFSTTLRGSAHLAATPPLPPLPLHVYHTTTPPRAHTPRTHYTTAHNTRTLLLPAVRRHTHRAVYYTCRAVLVGFSLHALLLHGCPVLRILAVGFTLPDFRTFTHAPLEPRPTVRYYLPSHVCLTCRSFTLPIFDYLFTVYVLPTFTLRTVFLYPLYT